MPSDPADLPGWMAALTPEQRLALGQQIVGGSLVSGPASVGMDPWADIDRSNPEIELPTPPAARSAYTLRVDIVGAKPPIWRRLMVRSDMTLDVVHRVLQAAFGWEDYHLHRFSTGDPYASPYFTTPADLEEGETGTPEVRARLDQVLTEVGGRLTYEYDFGDGWTHRLLLEGREAWPEAETRTAWCLTGRRAGPLEDSGGTWGYSELAAWVRGDFAAERAPDNADDLINWIPEGFDPDHFSVEETDEAIAAALLGDAAIIARSLGVREALVDLARRLPPASGATVARWLMAARLDSVPRLDTELADTATGPWRTLLRHVGDGVTLTNAGYLPPAVVQAIYGELGVGEVWYGKGNREDLTYPVLALREQTQALGLLRKAKGRLAPTAVARRLADDPVGLLRHVAARLPEGRRDDEQQAGWLLLAATAAGEGRAVAEGQVAAILETLGWRSSRQGGLSVDAAAQSAAPTGRVLRTAGGALGYRRADEPHEHAVLLARMALVAR